MPLKVRTKSQGCRLVLVLQGEWDIAQARRMADVLEMADASGAAEVIIDLRALAFMDSTAMGQVVAADARARRAGRRVILTRPRPSVYRIFEVTGVGDELDFVDPIPDRGTVA